MSYHLHTAADDPSAGPHRTAFQTTMSYATTMWTQVFDQVKEPRRDVPQCQY
jgi:hypothetical protein